MPIAYRLTLPQDTDGSSFRQALYKTGAVVDDSLPDSEKAAEGDEEKSVNFCSKTAHASGLNQKPSLVTREVLFFIMPSVHFRSDQAKTEAFEGVEAVKLVQTAMECCPLTLHEEWTLHWRWRVPMGKKLLLHFLHLGFTLVKQVCWPLQVAAKKH